MPDIASDDARDLTNAARELLSRLTGAEVTIGTNLIVATASGQVAFPALATGAPLERLADAVFRPALESALHRYVELLGQIAAGKSFPSAQISP